MKTYIVITGGAGFVGSHLIEHFLKKYSIRFEPTNPAPPVTIIKFFIWICEPGNVLLFRVLRQSTIGAERLDFRVRNGIGYYTFAIITRQSLLLKNNLIVKYKKEFLMISRI